MTSADANPTEATDAPDLIGTQIHFLHTGKGYPVKVGNHFETRLSQRAQTVTISPALWESSLNSRGESWLTQTAEQQQERYGFVWFSTGPCPASVEWWDPSSPAEVQIARDKARDLAHGLADEDERRKALATMNARFPRQETSTTLRTY
jgi:hypothetical protein